MLLYNVLVVNNINDRPTSQQTGRVIKKPLDRLSENLN